MTRGERSARSASEQVALEGLQGQGSPFPLAGRGNNGTRFIVDQGLKERDGPVDPVLIGPGGAKDLAEVDAVATVTRVLASQEVAQRTVRHISCQLRRLALQP